MKKILGLSCLLALFACALVDGRIATSSKSQNIGKFIVGTPLVFSLNSSYPIYRGGFTSRVYDRTDEKSRTDDSDERRRRKKRSTSFSAEEIQGIVDRHNLLRGQVSPEAANMEFMSWDDDLASMAQDWSDECLWEHGNPENISPFSQVGQNLWLGTGSQPDGVGSTQAWYNEDQYYDYDTDSCSHVCGHYTQVVWDDTYAVGCGRTFCSTVSNGWTNAYIVTCNYGPAGNYNGVRPYTSGSSCTQCESGIGECYENKCRLCSEHSETCECRANCQNCGTLNDDCTCTCRDGHYGSDCSTVCEDTHEYCGASPGWPLSWCNEDTPYVLSNCPLFCGLCNEADPSQTCDPSTSTPAPSTTTATSGGGGGDVETTIASVQTTTNIRTTSNIRTTTTAMSCNTTCENDGTVNEATCECDCLSDYQGERCEQRKSQVRYGVLVLVYTSIGRWPDLEDILLRIIGEIVTSWCNDNFQICCPNLGTLSSSSSLLSYVDETHVLLADGFPREESGLSVDAFWVMLLVTPPETTELCSAGSDFNSASRKRRWTEYDDVISRRDVSASESYLDQDALYQAVSDNIDTLEDELNVTVGEIEKGVVEPSTGSNGGLAPWVIALIVVVILLVVVVVLGVVLIMTMKGKRGRPVTPETSTERDTETGRGKPSDSKSSKHTDKTGSEEDGAHQERKNGHTRVHPARGKPTKLSPIKPKSTGGKTSEIQKKKALPPVKSSGSRKTKRDK